MNTLVLENQIALFAMGDKETKKKMFMQMLPYMLMAILVAVCLVPMLCHADGKKSAEDAIKSMIKIVKVIVSVVGVIFLIVGFVKFVIAHANEDGPSQQKAAMFVATGVALLVIGAVISGMNLEQMINTTGE